LEWISVSLVNVFSFALFIRSTLISASLQQGVSVEEADSSSNVLANEAGPI